MAAPIPETPTGHDGGASLEAFRHSGLPAYRRSEGRHGDGGKMGYVAWSFRLARWCLDRLPGSVDLDVDQSRSTGRQRGLQQIGEIG